MTDPTPFRFRILVVEDEPEWTELFKAVDKPLSDLGSVDYAETLVEVRSKLATNRYHFVSIDQNISYRPDEQVSAEYGVDLCQYIVDHHPLTDRAFYTSKGESYYANRAGTLDGTPYYEKRLGRQQRRALDVDDYVLEIAKRLTTGYIPWTLERAAHVLPPSLAAAASGLSDAWKESGDQRPRHVLDHLFSLSERTLWLCWAQACALAARIGSREFAAAEARDTVDYLDGVLRAVWGRIEPAWFHQWRHFIGLGNATTGRGIGVAFLSASDEIRQIRNLMRHDQMPAADARLLADLTPRLLRLIDAAAFWTEAPLITDPRYHPNDREKIQVQRLAGAPPWRTETIEATFTIPQGLKSERVFVPWHGPQGPFLLDLFPFVSMGRAADGRMEPQLLTPRHRGGYRRLSLVTNAVVDRAPTTDEYDAIAVLFNSSWRLDR